jgi:hypothetical protein
VLQAIGSGSGHNIAEHKVNTPPMKKNSSNITFDHLDKLYSLTGVSQDFVDK